MDKGRILKEEGKVSFSNRTELIQFVSNYLSLKYKEHLEFWRATATDDEDEVYYWEKRIEKEVPRLEKAIKKILRWKLIFKKKMSINSTSFIFERAFKKARINKSNSEGYFPINVVCWIDNLTFFQDVKSR